MHLLPCRCLDAFRDHWKREAQLPNPPYLQRASSIMKYIAVLRIHMYFWLLAALLGAAVYALLCRRASGHMHGNLFHLRGPKFSIHVSSINLPLHFTRKFTYNIYFALLQSLGLSFLASVSIIRDKP